MLFVHKDSQDFLNLLNLWNSNFSPKEHVASFIEFGKATS